MGQACRQPIQNRSAFGRLFERDFDKNKHLQDTASRRSGVEVLEMCHHEPRVVDRNPGNGCEDNVRDHCDITDVFVLSSKTFYLVGPGDARNGGSKEIGRA